jgi:hypothetical protein
MSWILLSSRGLELDQQFSGHPSACFTSMPCAFAARGLQCRLPRSPVSCVRPGWPPGTAMARRAARTYRASASRSAWGMPGVQSDVLLGALQPGADGTVTFVSLLRRYREGQRVVRMGSATAIRGRWRSMSGTVRRSSCGSASAWHQGCRCRGGLHQNPRRPERRARHSAGWRTR